MSQVAYAGDPQAAEEERIAPYEGAPVVVGTQAKHRGHVINYAGCDLWLIAISGGSRMQVHERSFRVLERQGETRSVVALAQERAKIEKAVFKPPEGKFWVYWDGSGDTPLGPWTGARVLTEARKSNRRNMRACPIGGNAWNMLEDLGFPIL